MPVLERRMSTSKKKGEEKDKPDWVDLLERKLTETIEGQSEAVMKRIADMEEKVKNEIDEVKTEVKKSIIKIGDIEQKTKKDLIGNTKKLQDRILMMDCKMLELHLHMRGLTEEPGDLRDQIITLLADFLQKSCEEIDNNCEVVYRVNSEFAKLKKLPRDVIIQLATKRLRDEILDRQTREPLMDKGKQVRIMKELPKQILQNRRNYRKLIEKLSTEHVRYRWLIPEGVNSFWKDKRIMIKSPEKMREFLNQEGKNKEGKQIIVNGD